MNPTTPSRDRLILSPSVNRFLFSPSINLIAIATMLLIAAITTVVLLATPQSRNWGSDEQGILLVLASTLVIHALALAFSLPHSIEGVREPELLALHLERLRLESIERIGELRERIRIAGIDLPARPPTDHQRLSTIIAFITTLVVFGSSASLFILLNLMPSNGLRGVHLLLAISCFGGWGASAIVVFTRVYTINPLNHQPVLFKVWERRRLDQLLKVTLLRQQMLHSSAANSSLDVDTDRTAQPLLKNNGGIDTNKDQASQPPQQPDSGSDAGSDQITQSRQAVDDRHRAVAPLTADLPRTESRASVPRPARPREWAFYVSASLSFLLILSSLNPIFGQGTFGGQIFRLIGRFSHTSRAINEHAVVIDVGALIGATILPLLAYLFARIYARRGNKNRSAFARNIAIIALVFAVVSLP